MKTCSICGAKISSKISEESCPVVFMINGKRFDTVLFNNVVGSRPRNLDHLIFPHRGGNSLKLLTTYAMLGGMARERN